MPSKASGKTDLSTNLSHRVVSCDGSTTGARNTSLLDVPHPHMSEDSGPSDLSSYDTASPLHFHGLADTQTQTQVASSVDSTGQGGTMPESRAIKKRKLSHDSKFHLAPKAPPKASNELPEARPVSRSGSKSKRRRSPSVASADSFAEAEEWDDPAKVFLASNRQFEVPLSELGRRTTEREISSIEVLPASGPGATKVQQYRVKSDGALSQVSDASPEAQGRRRSPVTDIPDDASTPPVMSNPGSIDYLDSRAEDYQATQLLASEDQDMNNTQVTDVIESQQRQTSAWNSEASRPSRNTRNILSMVNPEKKWRLQRGELLLQAALQNDSDGQTQPSSNFPGSSHVPSTGRKLFDQLAAQMHSDQQSFPRHDQERQSGQDSPPLGEDSQEGVIVPDSEPPESANEPSVPARLHLTPPKDSLHDGRVDPSLSQPALVPSMAVEGEVSRRRDEKDEQIDDDDEEDIPLHRTVHRPKTGAAPPSTKVNYPPKPRVLKPTGRTVETKASGKRGIRPRDNEIPSSVPEQDHRSSSVPPSPKLTSSRREGKEREDTEGDALLPAGRSGQVTPTPDEGSTEPADDLLMYTDDDVPLQDVKASSSRKRPRATRRKAGDGSAPRMASNTPSTILGARSAKRKKTHHPTATRVFALWKQDAAYFSGIVFERVGQSDRFKINFDDGDEDLLDLKNLRRLELQIGDRVSIIESHEKAIIANVDRQHQDTVIVRLTDDSSAELEIKVSGLKIQSRAIRSQWGDRTMNADEIVTLVSRTKLETPTTSLRNSSASLSKKVLSKVGIVVTLSVGRDWEREKDMITRIIRTSGGTVLDDWCDIFSLAGEYSFNKKRWVITSDDIGTKLKDDIHQVFLVSDAANAKPRFLIALALGIPCLSVEWLRDLSSGQCVVSDWRRYLLPAGYSDSLGARVTQMVDLDWGTTLDHLTGIMSNNVATKLFSKKSVLVLGPEYFPLPTKGKKGTSSVSDKKTSDGGRFIPRIIVSMGAARVEAVPELKYSSNPDLKDFQYVVVKDPHERPSVGGEKYVSMEWVKDCLIGGRMFPPRV